MSIETHRARIGLFDINRKCRLTGKNRFYVLNLAFQRIKLTFVCLFHFLFSLLCSVISSGIARLWSNHREIRTFFSFFLFLHGRLGGFLSVLYLMVVSALLFHTLWSVIGSLHSFYWSKQVDIKTFCCFYLFFQGRASGLPAIDYLTIGKCLFLLGTCYHVGSTLVEAFIIVTEIDRHSLKLMLSCIKLCDTALSSVMENFHNYYHRWSAFLHICGDVERNPGEVERIPG